MGAAKRAPRNIPREAGRTGKSTAGNRCEEEEECLSTEPTQTLTNQFPESRFHPITVGHIPLTSAAHPNLDNSFGFCTRCFLRTVLHFIY